MESSSVEGIQRYLSEKQEETVKLGFMEKGTQVRAEWGTGKEAGV